MNYRIGLIAPYQGLIDKAMKLSRAMSNSLYEKIVR